MSVRCKLNQKANFDYQDKKLQYQLYISDLDGTLVENGKSLSPESYSLLASLIEAGLHFTIISERPLYMIKRALRGINIEIPIGQLGGALVSDMKSEIHYVVNSIEAFTFTEIFELVKRIGGNLFVSSIYGNKNYFSFLSRENRDSNEFQQILKAIGDPRFRPLQSWKRVFSEHIVSIFIQNSESRKLKMYELHLENFLNSIYFRKDTILSEPHLKGILIRSVKATKGEATRQICRITKIPLENTVAFGNSKEDISMFNVVGKGIAMADSSAGLKEVAGELIGTAKENSVIEYLKKFLGKGKRVFLD